MPCRQSYTQTGNSPQAKRNMPLLGTVYSINKYDRVLNCQRHFLSVRRYSDSRTEPLKVVLALLSKGNARSNDRRRRQVTRNTVERKSI